MSGLAGEDSLPTTELSVRGLPGAGGIDAPGSEIGPYVVVAELGRGGMGIVYLAHDRELERDVALKIARRSDDPIALARFMTEARITGGLSHPAIIPVHDVGVDRIGRPFLVMKRISGRPWSSLLGQESLEERLEIFRRVAEGVLHAHARGVIHRDLKPSNVLVGDHGEVRVADWGLATTRNAERGTRNDPMGTGQGTEGIVDLTATGEILGTPGYAAPEQLAGERVARQDLDVYALGVILHECLAGERPFAAGSVAELLRAQAKGPPPLPAGQESRELAAIARRAMAPDPGSRYESVEALLDDLDRFAGGLAVHALPESLARRLRRTIGRRPVAATSTAAALVMALAVLAGGIRWRAGLEEREADAIREAALEGLAALDAADRALSQGPEDPIAASTHLAVARSLLELARARHAESSLSGHAFEELAKQVRAGLARSHFIDARRLLAAAGENWSGDPPHRARGRVLEDALAALARSRSLGLAGVEVDRLERELRGRGPLSVATDPPGAILRIHFLGATQTAPGPLVATIPGDGRELELDAGGYLLAIEHAGCATVRLPLYLMRGEARGRDLAVELPAASDVPAGYVYVPPGPTLVNQGCEFLAVEKGFAISLAELTWGEWAPFAAELPAGERPRWTLRDGRSFDALEAIRGRRPGDWESLPAFFLSRQDLERYAAWRSDRDPRFVFRLPTDREWERAMRGADGREYPWGDEWDPARSNSVESAASTDPGRVLELASDPKRESGRSVFGLWHGAGNVAEWTAPDSLEEKMGTLRGGSAFQPRDWGRIWHAIQVAPDTRQSDTGGRLAAVRRR